MPKVKKVKGKGGTAAAASCGLVDNDTLIGFTAQALSDWWLRFKYVANPDRYNQLFSLDSHQASDISAGGFNKLSSNLDDILKNQNVKSMFEEPSFLDKVRCLNPQPWVTIEKMPCLVVKNSYSYKKEQADIENLIGVLEKAISIRQKISNSGNPDEQLETQKSFLARLLDASDSDGDCVYKLDPNLIKKLIEKISSFPAGVEHTHHYTVKKHGFSLSLLTDTKNSVKCILDSEDSSLLDQVGRLFDPNHVLKDNDPDLKQFCELYHIDPRRAKGAYFLSKTSSIAKCAKATEIKQKHALSDPSSPSSDPSSPSSDPSSPSSDPSSPSSDPSSPSSNVKLKYDKSFAWLKYSNKEELQSEINKFSDNDMLAQIKTFIISISTLLINSDNPFNVLCDGWEFKFSQFNEFDCIVDALVNRILDFVSLIEKRVEKIKERRARTAEKNGSVPKDFPPEVVKFRDMCAVFVEQLMMLQLILTYSRYIYSAKNSVESVIKGMSVRYNDYQKNKVQSDDDRQKREIKGELSKLQTLQVALIVLITGDQTTTDEITGYESKASEECCHGFFNYLALRELLVLARRTLNAKVADDHNTGVLAEISCAPSGLVKKLSPDSLKDLPDLSVDDDDDDDDDDDNVSRNSPTWQKVNASSLWSSERKDGDDSARAADDTRLPPNSPYALV